MKQNVIIGIDEAGRGPWAGPLVGVAVLLLQPIKGLNDSKQLTSKKRRLLRCEINAKAIVGIGWAQPAYIDAHGLTDATAKVMRQALSQLPQAPGTKIVIDGSYNYLPGVANVETVVKADALFPSVSAASIVAKEARDAFMAAVDTVYPEYQFGRHKGYGTALHSAMLKEHGISPMHRKSFKPIAGFL